MKRWSGGITMNRLRRKTDQSVVWYCKSCEKSTIAQVPHNVIQAIRCPACGTLKEARE
jgi:rubrerythrin